MGKVVSEIDFSEFTPDKYNKILEELNSTGLRNPKGRLYHIALQKGKGMEILGLWESEKDFNDFSKALVPLLQKNGIKLTKPSIYPVFNYLH